MSSNREPFPFLNFCLETLINVFVWCTLLMTLNIKVRSNMMTCNDITDENILKCVCVVTLLQTLHVKFLVIGYSKESLMISI